MNQAATQPEKPRPPQPFGKYLLLERVAIGGMAEVYRGKLREDKLGSRHFAIKRILPNVAENQEFVDMFIDEAKIASQLSHMAICPIYELGRLGATYYMALEYVSGRDVLQVINRFRKQRERMPAVMVAFIGLRICEALAFAHSRKGTDGKNLNIIHRDVSPQNILVSFEGQVKLIDFGISKAAFRTTQTQVGVLKGKFGYMSPEQIKHAAIDQRSDLFSVGVSLYEMAACDRLFAAEGDIATLEKTRAAQVKPLTQFIPGFPPALEQIILKALASNPDERWQSAQEMVQALRDFLGTQGAYGTSTLSKWMKTAFARELTEEQAKEQGWASFDLEALAAEAETDDWSSSLVMPEPPNVPTDLTLVRNTESETRLIPASGSLSVIFFQHETMGISGISNKQQKLSEEATLLHGSQTPGREPLRSKTPSSVHLGLSSVTADLSQARVTKRQKLLFIASGALLVFVGALITYLLY